MSLLNCEESYFFSSDERNGALNKSQNTRQSKRALIFVKGPKF